MKLLVLFISLFSFSAIANQDSVAFFYRPEKVIVLINERIEAGMRLEQFLNALGGADHIEATSQDGTISFTCGRAALGNSCRFVFTPSEKVIIQDRALSAIFSANDLGITTSGKFEMTFAGSMKDRFSLRISEDGTIDIFGSKRMGNN